MVVSVLRTEIQNIIAGILYDEIRTTMKEMNYGKVKGSINKRS
jgi:hypothetical protein